MRSSRTKTLHFATPHICRCLVSLEGNSIELYGSCLHREPHHPIKSLHNEAHLNGPTEPCGLRAVPRLEPARIYTSCLASVYYHLPNNLIADRYIDPAPKLKTPALSLAKSNIGTFLVPLTRKFLTCSLFLYFFFAR